MSTLDRSPVLRVNGLRKSFGSNEVLKGLSFTVAPGEILALLGANGAGKSTAIACLSAAQTPDGGTIEIDGAPLTATDPRDALEAGVAVIYQHLSLVDALTVAENVFLGDERTTPWGAVDVRAQHRNTTELLAQVGADFDPRARVGSLSTGERQLVEIAKALRRNPRLLILDEPTAALSAAETEVLLNRVDRLRRDRDVAIIFVSHLLDEVFALADRVAVMRDGTMALESRIADVRPAEVIAAIAPDLVDGGRTRMRASVPGAPLVVAEEMSAEGIGPVSLRVSEGECVALFGMLGSGRTELIETLVGLRPLAGGSLHWRGRPARGALSFRIAAGMSFVPADRKQRALFAALSAADNVLIPHERALARWGGIARDRSAEKETYRQVTERFHVHPSAPGYRGGAFSGGNQQKLILGRWLCGPARTRLLLMDEPTQGIDVGARHDIYQHIDALVDDGMGVLFATSDPDEAIRLADRIHVLHRGRIIRTVSAADTDIADLLQSAHAVDTPSPADHRSIA